MAAATRKIRFCTVGKEELPAFWTSEVCAEHAVKFYCSFDGKPITSLEDCVTLKSGKVAHKACLETWMKAQNS